MPPDPDVLVCVLGGVADVSVLNPNVVVEVRDYDVDGLDEKDLCTDEDGDRYSGYTTSEK